MSVTRERKLTVFRKYSGTICPACRGDKSRMHWLCQPCQRSVPWHVRAIIGTACAAHVLAAELQIRAARQRRGPDTH